MLADIMFVASIVMFVLVIKDNPLLLQGSRRIDIWRLNLSNLLELSFKSIKVTSKLGQKSLVSRGFLEFATPSLHKL